MLHLTPSKLKLVNYLLHNQHLNLLKNYDFSRFWSKMEKNSISQGTFNTNFGVNNWPMFLPKVSKEALWMGLRYMSLYENIRFLENDGCLKIRLLQCYEVLFWIHNVDAICSFDCVTKLLKDIDISDKKKIVRVTLFFCFCRNSEYGSWVILTSTDKSHYLKE